MGDRHARLEPVDADTDSEADVRRRLAEAVRDQVERRKRSRRLMDYDDLLVHLRDALADPATGEAAADTGAQPLPRRDGRRVPGHRPGAVGDPRDARSTGTATLVLIGDPKQAIYAFRGADVVTYLQATDAAADERDARHQLAQRRSRC